jgi:hypothetical protein
LNDFLFQYQYFTINRLWGAFFRAAHVENGFAETSLGTINKRR